MVRILDMDERHLQAYSCCLEEYQEQIVEGSERKREWIEEMLPKGLRCKVAVNEEEKAIGMIEYMPIEVAPAVGHDLYFINCIWVHGHASGVGKQQKRGVGKAMLNAAEQDALELGAHGMAAWGLVIPAWMRASWYRRHGYRNADRQSVMGLVWKPFRSDAEKPSWIKTKPRPDTVPGKLTITAYLNGQCPLMNYRYKQLSRIAAEFGDSVEFRTISTLDKEAILSHGAKDAFFLDKKELFTGPPPPEEKLRKRIRKAVKKAGAL